jgi:CBS domain-containing protein
MNIIAGQIAEFLKNYAPFNQLTSDELNEIASNVRVINLEKKQTLFKINDALHDSFYVVASGVVNISVIADAEESIINKCHEGTIFGLRPFFAKNKYKMTAKAREESLVYAIPIAVFKPLLANNSEVLNFLLESFASNLPEDRSSQGNLVTDGVFYTEKQSEAQFFQTLAYNTTPLLATSDSTAQEVAQLMAESLKNNVIIFEKSGPIGIVTHADLASKIATGRYPISIPVSNIMSSPVVTVLENVSLAEAQLLMLKNNVTHLCVTLDGTDKSVIKGVISEHDLIAAQASNPGVLIKEVKRSLSPNELKEIRTRLTNLIQSSIQKNIPLTHITNIASEINFAILKRAVELSILDLGSPPARFAWLSLGSQGRKEQLLLTDQDSILVFEDVAQDKYIEVKDYFLKLGKKTTAILEKIGYQLCPNGHMGSNMMWCKSLTDWIKQYNNWMNSPRENLDNLSSIFFDCELVIGEQKIETAINNIIFENAYNNTLFLDFLGNDALRKNSPLSFFKKFVVEEDGIHKDKFDIKTRALMPLIDSARLFALNFDIKGINNTYTRFKQLAITDAKHSEIYLNCAEAYLFLTRIRTLEGLKNENSGQYINLEELSKNDREKLKNALIPMKELEELIKDTFQLTQFS